MRKHILIILLLGTSGWLFGQYEKKADSIRSRIATMNDDTAKVKAYVKLLSYVTALNPREAKLTADTALKLARQINDRKGEANVLNAFGTIFRNTGQLGNALKYFQDAYEIRKEINDRNGIAGSLNNIGLVYGALHEAGQAIKYYSEALKMNQELNDIRNIGINYLNIGAMYGDLNNTDSMIHYCLKAIDYCNRAKDLRNIAYASNNLGIAYISQKKFKEAKEFLEKSLAIRQELGDPFTLGMSHESMGELYLAQKKYAQANQHFETALSLARQVDDLEGMSSVHNWLSKSYEATGDFKRALEEFRKSKTYGDSILNQESSKQLAELQALYDKESKEKELTELRAAHLENQHDLNQQKALVLFAIISVLVIVLAGVAYYLRSRMKHKVADQLEKYTRDLETVEAIGKKITSSHSIEDINQIVFEYLNKLMDAPGFGIGVLNEAGDTISFPGYIERDKKYPMTHYYINEDRLASICVREKKEILIRDFKTDILKHVKSYSAPKTGEAVSSLIYLPLVNNDRLVGCITVQSFKPAAYGDYELRLFRNIANYAAIALENAGLYMQMEERIRKGTEEVVKQSKELEVNYQNTQLLGEIGQKIISNLHFKDLFEELYAHVNKLMPAEILGVRIYHEDQHAIEYKFEFENGVVHEPLTVPITNDDNYSVWCIKNRKDIFINDNLAEHTRYVKKIHVVAGEMPHSLIFCPMMIGEKVLGCVTVQSFKKQAYTPYHLSILRTLTGYTAIAFENANLYATLEERVKERTTEVIQQKEEIEKSYENTRLLSEIGKEISGMLSIEAIITQVYAHINKLMDAAAFGIGIYREKENDLYHPAVMENGQRLSPFSYSLDEDRIAIQCFKSNVEFIINDWRNEYHYFVKDDTAPVEGEATQSLIYLPLVSKGKVIGVLTVQSFQTNAYTEYHLNILRNLAIYVASALENAGLYEQMEQKVERRTEEIRRAYENTRLLSQIQKDISSSLSVETIISKVYQNVNTLMDAACFGIGILDEQKRCIRMPGFIENGKEMEEFSYSIDDPNRLAIYCYANQSDIFINDFQTEYVNYIKGVAAPVSGSDASSIIYLPLIVKEKVIGVITVQSFRKNAYTDYHLNILRNLAASVAIAIDNATLYSNMEEKVRERTAEVVRQKEVIEEKNKDITDSIRYAKKIQTALLTPLEKIKESVPNSFVIFQPRDIVSGDFYWFSRINEYLVFTVSDCTGHGVPGAVMSAICIDILNQVVHENEVRSPGEALNRIDRKLISMLRHENTEQSSYDGMDSALCSIDTTTGELQFAGANRPLLLVRNGQLQEVKPSKHSIGSHHEGEKAFRNTLIDIHEGDRLYLFTDGYADQFGGPKGKKFKYKKLQEAVMKSCHLPMEEQGKYLQNMIEDWRGDLEQVDDICMMGLQF